MTNHPDTKTQGAEGLGFTAHDHDTCIASGLAAAEARCMSGGLQLTPARRRVLEILLREHRALGAYDILDILRKSGTNAQPPTAYRALDFLVENGLAHRIEKLNAFIACSAPDTLHSPAFLICRKCDAVAEEPAPSVSSALQQSAENTGFEIEAAVLEAEGVCPKCRETPDT